jgi:hypothetical protein
VSAGIERILVEVEKNNSTIGGGHSCFMGGSTQDNGILSTLVTQY